MKTRWILTCVILFGSVTGSAVGVENRWYAGATVGQWMDDEGAEFPNSGFPFSSIDDGIASGFLGLRLSERFAVEAGYYDLGGFVCCDYSSVDFVVQPPTFDFDRRGTSLGVVGTHPVGRFQLFAKVGVLSWKSEGTIIGFQENRTVSEDGTDALFGVGVAFRAAKVLDFRVQWEFSEVDGQDLQALTAGLQFNF